jgi:hypothetical protein
MEMASQFPRVKFNAFDIGASLSSYLFFRSVLMDMQSLCSAHRYKEPASQCAVRDTQRQRAS